MTLDIDDGYRLVKGHPGVCVLPVILTAVEFTPACTGIGLFGDDREPIRLRKSLGSVVQLIDAILTDAVYPCPEALINQALMPEVGEHDLARLQQRLLAFEGFDPQPDASQPEIPDFDALLNLKPEHPVRLVPGFAGKALFQPE
jgi:hypothetical protein